MVDIAISAPARSIDAQATSTSRLRITSRIESWCTSTSYIETSSESGSIPWLIVRLPCGSRSTQSTRWPRSTNAAARLSVVVVLATPPFWFAKAMTWALDRHRAPYCTRWTDSFTTCRPIPALFEKRLVFVTGKGGVGKTTVAAALGLAAARAGKRTIVCEVAEQERFSRLFGREGVGYEETEIAPDLNAVSLDPQHTLEEWVAYQLRSTTLAGLLYRSRIFQYLTSAAPGINELVTIGKIWELAQLQRTTGGAAVRLRDRGLARHRPRPRHAARAAHVRDVARVGPIAARPTASTTSSRQRRTGVLAVALPEEMPVNETLEFERAAQGRARDGRRRDRRERRSTRRASAAPRRARSSRSTAAAGPPPARRCAPRSPSTGARASSGPAAPAAARRSRRAGRRRCRSCSSRSSGATSSSGCRPSWRRKL